MKNVITVLLLALMAACGSESDSSSGGSGTAGSLARFSIVNNNLYVLDWQNIVAFSLADPLAPQQFDSEYVWGGETLFNHQDAYLLAGKNDGVEIFELGESGELTSIAEHSHMTACDPVVAEGNYAYVTTRGGNNCFGGIDQIEVLDISNIRYPVPVYQQNMRSPSGLAVIGEDVFVCDISEGLQRFKVIKNGEVVELEKAYVNDVYACNDLIIKGDLLILSHDHGITQIRWQNDQFTVLSELQAD